MMLAATSFYVILRRLNPRLGMRGDISGEAGSIRLIRLANYMRLIQSVLAFLVGNSIFQRGWDPPRNQLFINLVDEKHTPALPCAPRVFFGSRRVISTS